MRPITVFNLTTGVNHAICLDADSALESATRMTKDLKPADRDECLDKVKAWLSVHREVGASTSISCGTFVLQIDKRIREGQ